LSARPRANKTALPALGQPGPQCHSYLVGYLFCPERGHIPLGIFTNPANALSCPFPVPQVDLPGQQIMNWRLYIILYIGVVVTFWFVLGLAFIGIRALMANRKTVLFACWKGLYTVVLFYLYLILLAVPLLAMYLLIRFFLESSNFSENQILRVSAIICLVLGVWLSPKIKRTIYKWVGISKIGLVISWQFAQIPYEPPLWTAL
jgi:hypothetical protein